MTRITETAFIAGIEDLIAELMSRRGENGGLRRRWHEALVAGYGRALALEGERRQLHERQLQLAGRPELDTDALQELTGLAQREARLGRRERELRALLKRLRSAALRPQGQSH